MRARSLLLVGGIVSLGMLLRTVYLLTPPLDSDQAIVGLMARHILQGEFPIFFWGQAFNGTLEAYLAVLLFYLFGPSRLVLDLSPFLFSVAFLLLTYRLGCEAFDREVGLLAFLLAALPAPFLTGHSITARDSYVENLCLGTLVLLLTLRVFQGAGPRRRSVFILGLFAVLAWYVSPQSIHFLLASALFLLLRAPRVVFDRRFGVVAPAFLLGSLPLWVYNLYNLLAPSTSSTLWAIYDHASMRTLHDSLTRYLEWKIPAILGAIAS